MRDNVTILIAAIVLLALVSGGVYGVYTNRASTKSSSCFAGPGEICPPDEFINDYNEVMSIQKEVRQMAQSNEMKRLRAKSDQFKGMAQRLGTEIPDGYSFDDKTRKFVIAPKPAVVPTPAPPISGTTKP